jgi:hypothetical protein
MKVVCTVWDLGIEPGLRLSLLPCNLREVSKLISQVSLNACLYQALFWTLETPSE